MFDNIVVVGGPLILSSVKEVHVAENQLGICFPTGYREYVMRFGEGVLGGSYLRIYPPRRILTGDNNLTEWRKRIQEFWFWHDGAEVLTKEQALESVIIGDTLDGDELVVHPTHAERIYVLPRNSEGIHIAGDGLPAAIEWLCNSGTLTEPFSERHFEPYDSRV
ncbi:MAG: SMI1/KNR4 family protein [Fimbriiglobus sp.]